MLWNHIIAFGYRPIFTWCASEQFILWIIKIIFCFIHFVSCYLSVRTIDRSPICPFRRFRTVSPIPPVFLVNYFPIESYRINFWLIYDISICFTEWINQTHYYEAITISMAILSFSFGFFFILLFFFWCAPLFDISFYQKLSFFACCSPLSLLAFGFVRPLLATVTVNCAEKNELNFWGKLTKLKKIVCHFLHKNSSITDRCQRKAWQLPSRIFFAFFFVDFSSSNHPFSLLFCLVRVHLENPKKQSLDGKFLNLQFEFCENLLRVMHA